MIYSRRFLSTRAVVFPLRSAYTLATCLTFLAAAISFAQAQNAPPPSLPPPHPVSAAPVPAGSQPGAAGPQQDAQVVPTLQTLGPLPAPGIASPPLPASWQRITTAVASCTQPPTIDGRLDDPCWRTASHAAGFWPLVVTTPISPGDQTEVWYCASQTTLYVAFHCKDSQPDKIHASETVRDSNGIFNDDNVEVDIDSQNSRHGYSSFYLSARGTQFEQIEGGTATNITWEGDWQGATQRTADGWTAEMAIPFRLLRYPRGAHEFGMGFFRYLARTGVNQAWPYYPPAGEGPGEGEYMDEFTGLAPNYVAPRPVFLPYVLSTAGSGNSAREGIDIKYPLTTTLTSVASLHPDFQTVEQDVTNINFSYDEKLLTDLRPFFAEGSSFFPTQDLFYSRQIGDFDEGIKIAGKQNDTTIGVLGTTFNGSANAQSATVVNLQQDIGQFSHVLVDGVDDVQNGQPSNQTMKVEGQYGWEAAGTRYAFTGNVVPSWQGSRSTGSEDLLQFNNTAAEGQLNYTLGYQNIDRDFISDLGYVPEVDRRGETLNLDLGNAFGKGAVQQYTAYFNADDFQHDSGGFYHSDIDGGINVSMRSGLSYQVDLPADRRNQLDSVTSDTDRFTDYAPTFTFGWGGKTLYQGGSVSDALGRQAGQRYNFLTFSQGIFVQRPFNVQLNYSRLLLGNATSTQAIITGTYRLTPERTVGFRILNQEGVDQGTGLGTNIYFSFGQHVRSGSDIYLLFGDPNSAATRGEVTLKLIRPY